MILDYWIMSVSILHHTWIFSYTPYIGLLPYDRFLVIEVPDHLLLN